MSQGFVGIENSPYADHFGEVFRINDIITEDFVLKKERIDTIRRKYLEFDIQNSCNEARNKTNDNTPQYLV